jgi:hypothetical protein
MIRAVMPPRHLPERSRCDCLRLQCNRPRALRWILTQESRCR